MRAWSAGLMFSNVLSRYIGTSQIIPKAEHLDPSKGKDRLKIFKLTVERLWNTCFHILDNLSDSVNIYMNTSSMSRILCVSHIYRIFKSSTLLFHDKGWQRYLSMNIPHTHNTHTNGGHASACSRPQIHELHFSKNAKGGHCWKLLVPHPNFANIYIYMPKHWEFDENLIPNLWHDSRKHSDQCGWPGKSVEC